MIKKVYFSIAIVLVLALAGTTVIAYRALYSDNVKLDEGASAFIHLREGSSLEDCLDSLRAADLLYRYWTLDQTARLLSLDEQTITGRYEIKGHMSNYDLIRMFRSGHQSPVNILIRPARTKTDLVAQLSRQLEATDSDFLHTLDSLFAGDNGLDSLNFFAKIIPNTYQMYWNTGPERVFRRLFTESEDFWERNGRLEKARRLNLEPVEVYTLASIVDRETNVPREKPVIAGVYLNRLERGMALQADPTIVYALGDFDLTRVLHKHLEVESPFNTYKYPGLPPGPIGMTTIQGIDSVLAAKEHDYLYFCAKADGAGEHVFATHLQGHLRNARIFHRWLNRQKR